MVLPSSIALRNCEFSRASDLSSSFHFGFKRPTLETKVNYL